MMALNSLLPQFEALLEPEYVSAYKENVVGRLLEHQVSIEDVRRRPGSYRVKFGIPTEPSLVKDSCNSLDIAVPVGSEVSIPVRCYAPKISEPKKLAVHVNFHGGGWTVGGVGADEKWCQELAVEAQAVVFDVGYRLAPEHKFPTAIEDSWAALTYIHDNAIRFNIDVRRLSLGGVSAGANIAAVLTHRCISESLIRPVFLSLCVPPVDASALTADFEVAADCPYQSWISNRNAPFLSYARMSWFYRHYLPERPSLELLKSPYLSPLYSVQSEGFRADLHPPTLVCVAEVDVLCSEGEAYADALRFRGVDVSFQKFLRVPHNFSRQTVLLPQAREYVRLSISMLKRALSAEVE